jgi:glycosyltransferase involved in cell wall biosynthesis
MNQRQILYIHPSNELYGADRVLLRLVRNLDKKKYTPHVVVANDLKYEGLLTDRLATNEIQYTEASLGVLRRKYQSPQGLGLFAYRTLHSARRLGAYCDNNHIDFIHSNSTAVFTGGQLARWTKLPHLWHVHEIITQPSWLNKIIAGTLYRYADQVVAVSGPVRDHLLEAKPELENKIVVIHNRIDPRRFLAIDQQEIDRMRASWRAANDTIVIGTVGRINDWKGQEFLLESARQVIEFADDVRFVFVGGTVPGEEWRVNDLQRKVDALGLTEHVSIESFRLDIPVVLAAFDIFVLPSIRPDPFPTVVLEAMASGKPVIASAHGGAIEQVVDKKTGYLVSPAATQEMTDAIISLIIDPGRRQEMGLAGHLRLMNKFTLDQFIQNIEALYEQLAAIPVNSLVWNSSNSRGVL